MYFFIQVSKKNTFIFYVQKNYLKIDYIFMKIKMSSNIFA